MKFGFDRLEFERFRSFIKPAVIEFDQFDAGLHFIRGRNLKSKRLGSNGAGKSSIFDALMWCIYGETVRGLKSPDIKPWSGKGTTRAYFEFRIDHRSHSIERTANPNLLKLDGREVSQAEVDKVIGVSSEVFLQAILLGQSKELFFDLKPKAKLDLFVDVLKLNRWDHRAEMASRIASVLEREIAKSGLMIDRSKEELKTLQEEIADLKGKRDAWEDQQSGKIERVEKEIAELKKNITRFQRERDDADLSAEHAGMELPALAKALDDLFDEERKLEADIAKGKTDVELRARTVSRINDEIKALKEDRCPTCRRPMTDHKVIKRKIRELEDEKAEFRPTKLGRDVLKNHDRLEKVKARILTLRKALLKFRKQENEALDVLGRLNPRIAGWEASISNLRRQLEGQQDEANPFTEQVREKQKRLSSLKAEISREEKSVAKMERKLIRRQFWIKGFKEIKLYTITEVLQELEMVTNSMMDEFGLEGWQVFYEVEKENKSGGMQRLLNVFIKSPDNDKPVKWECWSGGEGQRLRIIGALGLSEVLLNHAGVTPDLEVLDEPTKGLSVEGVRDLCDILADRGRRLGRRLFLIDHHAVESSRFSSILTVTKGNGGSGVDFRG